MVPEGHVGIITARSGNMKVVGKGLHVINPFNTKTELMPKGPVRMDGEVRNVITQDGWNISAHYQLNALLVDELLVRGAGGDWRVATNDSAERILRTELENNDASDLRPRPQALDEGVTEEINILTRRWGVEVDWLRVTIRWAYAIPPAHIVHQP
jgi:regulator of protease activity HflC (stomatin/prohibitin superfamily)